MFQNLRNRITFKKAAVVLTFALVITGSGLSSLASLSDTLNDTVVFNTLAVNLKDGTADESSITFSAIDPSATSNFQQDLNLTNTGNASATVRLDSSVTVGAGSDLDAAIISAISDGTCASGGPRIVGSGGMGVWPSIEDVDANFPSLALNAGESKAICIKWQFNANIGLTTTTLTALYKWTATHP